MSKFFRVRYHGADLAALNIVCRFCNLLHLSDISKCDGITLDNFVTLDYVETSHSHVFPKEEPLASDFRLWRDAIHRQCFGTSTLSVSLGQYIHPPHIACRWFTTADATMLYYHEDNSDNVSYIAYVKCDVQRTRHGHTYLQHSRKIGMHPGTHYASVTMLDSDCPILHSRSLILSPQTTQLTFHKRLVSCGTPDIWDNLSVDRDELWLQLGLLTGSLCIAHDGSYMAKELTTLCLAGIVIYCRTSQCWLKALVAEHSDLQATITASFWERS
jgi:hypothetical protein